MDVTARPAEPDELAIVTSLCRAATDELRPHRGGEIWSQRDARPEPVDVVLAEVITADDGLVLLGCIDDVAVGYAVAQVEELHDHRTIGHLTDLYVMPEARGVGVGEALMTAVLDWSGQQGCIGIDSLALPGDRATKNFFESFGLVARALRVHRTLSLTARSTSGHASR